MKQDPNEILRCLETIHLTDPALIKERAAELEVLEVFALQTFPGLRRTKKNRRRFYPVPTLTPSAFVDEVKRRSQNEITSKNFKKTETA
tara:strand:- start:541 stop:807 length:267 start_codon:yes stop_codon:yes gene_type:complete